MNPIKRAHLKQLISAAYELAMSLSVKEEDELSIQEHNLLNAVNHCSDVGLSSRSVEDIGRVVSVFTNKAFVGAFEYSEIFGERDLISNGTVISLGNEKYIVYTIMLKSDKQMTLEVLPWEQQIKEGVNI